MNQDTVNQLRSKHPSPLRELNFLDPPSDEECLQVSETDVQQSIKSFDSGSAPGMDGFYPQYFKDLTSVSSLNAGNESITTLTNLCNFILRGKVKEEICQYVYGASLCALTKKDGGIRPIAVGLSLRRLVSKLACRHINEEIGKYLYPVQLGFGTKQGCEAAVHATRTYVTMSTGTEKVLLKIDFRNAFNSIERDVMLHEVKKKTPSLYHYFWQCYRNSSLLFYGEESILSEIGAQQGDPTGPLLFSLTIQPMIEKLMSDLNVWYLDDGSICDVPEMVLQDLEFLVNEAAKLGLRVNPSKCELFFCSGTIDAEIVSKFNDICPGICVTSKEDLNLLGAPILEEGFPKFSRKIVSKMEIMFERLKCLNSHTALFILRNCFAIPKLTYLMRTTPVWMFQDFTMNFDNKIKDLLESLLNVSLNNKQWIQATMPINFGGLGIRRLCDVSLPAFISSSCGVKDHVSHILKLQDMPSISHFDEALNEWNEINCQIQPNESLRIFQKNWDSINVKRIINESFTAKRVQRLVTFHSVIKHWNIYG